jgi:hypothetical protein
MRQTMARTSALGRQVESRHLARLLEATLSQKPLLLPGHRPVLERGSVGGEDRTALCVHGR